MQEKPIRLAVVGSRNLLADNDQNRLFFYAMLDQVIDANFRDKSICIVTGDEKNGADRLAKEYAEEMGIPCIVKKADWDLYPNRRAAGPIRNSEIVLESDVMIAFPPTSRRGGTHDSIEKMEKKGGKIFQFPVSQ